MCLVRKVFVQLSQLCAPTVTKCRSLLKSTFSIHLFVFVLPVRPFILTYMVVLMDFVFFISAIHDFQRRNAAQRISSLYAPLKDADW